MALPDDVVIGVSLPRSGRYGQTAGIVYDRAYRLWVDQVNQKGGLLGRTVRLLAYNDGSIPERAADNYRRLIHEDQAHLLLGPCHSVLVEAVVPVVEKARRLLLQGSGSSHEIFRKNRKYLFLCWSGCDFDYPKSYLGLMAGMRSRFSLESIGLIHTDGRIGRAVALGVRHYAPLYGMRIVHDETISEPPCDYEGFCAGSNRKILTSFLRDLTTRVLMNP